MNPLELLNATLTSEITSEQFTKIAMESIVTPSLIILFISMSLIFLLLGFAMVKGSKKKYYMIWLIATAISGVILTLLIALPNYTQSIIDTIKSWITEMF